MSDATFEPGSPEVCALLDRAAKTIADLSKAQTLRNETACQAREAFEEAKTEAIERCLSQIDIEQMGILTNVRVSILDRIRESGYENIARLCKASVWELQRIDGAGETTTTMVKAAADKILRAAKDQVRVRIDTVQRPESQKKLLERVRLQHHIDDCLSGKDDPFPFLRSLQELYNRAMPAKKEEGFFVRLKRSLLGPGPELQEALKALPTLRQVLESERVKEEIRLSQSLHPSFTTSVWEDFLSNPAAFYFYLTKLGVIAGDPIMSDATFEPGSPEVCDLFDRAAKTIADLSKAQTLRNETACQAREAFEEVKTEAIERCLSQIDIEQISILTNVRVSTLDRIRESGYDNIARLCKASAWELQRIDDVSGPAARDIERATEQLALAAKDNEKVRIDAKRRPVSHERLLKRVRLQHHIDNCLSDKDDPFPFLRSLQELYKRAMPAKKEDPIDRIIRLVIGPRPELQEALKALPTLRQVLESERVKEEIRLSQSLHPSFTTSVWEDFLSNPAAFYFYLTKLGVSEADEAATTGGIPEEIINNVRSHPLDESLLRIPLRPYQSFGARYILNQRCVLLGDEMGLGKTIQALAAMAHLAAHGERGFLVVCPAAVVSNWAHEIQNKSSLEPVIIGSTGRKRAISQLTKEKVVGVTSYGTLRSLHMKEMLNGLEFQMLVADEAHYVKNPDRGRSEAIGVIAERTSRVLFLSGTPVENRLLEFYSLINYLQPGLPANEASSRAAAVVSPSLFREQVAPVYLRRNQKDVLKELPEMIESDEWLTIGINERDHYNQQVLAGNFMGMRRSVVIGDGRAATAKLERLKEIVEEAKADGQKVIVFSFFCEVIDRVMAELPEAFGPITGSVPSAGRLNIIEQFTAAEKPSILVAQIVAGGTGLNIQAASVVVIMEPQIKPSLESQAIARTHRMGQTRPVQVFRLLADESVDQRMVELLAKKRKVIDGSVGPSTFKDESEEAVDVSDTRDVIRLEQERLNGATSFVTPKQRNGSNLFKQVTSDAEPTKKQAETSCDDDDLDAAVAKDMTVFSFSRLENILKKFMVPKKVCSAIIRFFHDIETPEGNEGFEARDRLLLNLLESLETALHEADTDDAIQGVAEALYLSAESCSDPFFAGELQLLSSIIDDVA